MLRAGKLGDGDRHLLVVDGVGNLVGGLMHGFERGVTAVFGTSNARYVRKMQVKVEAIYQPITPLLGFTGQWHMQGSSSAQIQ